MTLKKKKRGKADMPYQLLLKKFSKTTYSSVLLRHRKAIKRAKRQ